MRYITPVADIRIRHVTITMNLSIIIVSWNTRNLLARCLSSLYRHFPSSEFEVFVIDNASKDGSASMVLERFPQVQLIENDENVGYAKANNQAIHQSSSRYVLLLNPDTEIKSGAFETLVRYMDEHPQTGAAGAKLLNPDGTLQVSCYPAPTLSRELWRLFHLDRIKPYGIYEMRGWDLNKPRQVDCLQGACLIIRREVLDQVGLLDEDYFIYSEEVDLCYRMKKAGWQLYWVPSAKVVHFGGQSTNQVAEDMFLQLYRGKILFFRKHYGLLAAYIYKLVLLVSTLARLALTPLARLEKQPRRRQHLILARQYHRLLTALPGM